VTKIVLPLPEGYERRYTSSRGRMSHIILANGNSQHEDALCRALPTAQGWFGTGTQDERERAEALPECAKCATVMRRLQRAMAKAVDDER